MPAGHRLGEAEALQEVGAEAGELLGLLGRLDTLGDGAEVEVAGQRDDRRGDLAWPSASSATNERSTLRQSTGRCRR